MNTSTASTQSLFTAKALFSPKKLWYGKYDKFWFASNRYSKPDATDKEQFHSLKRYIDQNVLPVCSELIIFDNRQFSDNYGPKIVDKPKNNIVFSYINENIDDKTMNLGFLDKNVSAQFLKKILNDFAPSIETPDFLKNEIYLEPKNYSYALHSAEKIIQKYNL